MFPTHAYLTFGGKLAKTLANPEIWQCGIRFIGGGAGGFAADPQAYAQAAATPLTTWLQSPNSYIPSNVTLEWVKCNNINPDGTYADNVTHVYDLPAPVSSTLAAQDFPPILTTAISWVTDATRGPAHTGRIYPPNYAVPMKSTGDMHISATAQQALANQGWKLIQDLSAIQDGGVSPLMIVASKINATKNGIIGCRVGSVVDVQRRRKSAEPETYLSNA